MTHSLYIQSMIAGVFGAGLGACAYLVPIMGAVYLLDLEVSPNQPWFLLWVGGAGGFWFGQHGKSDTTTSKDD